jgi:MFS family permease
VIPAQTEINGANNEARAAFRFPGVTHLLCARFCIVAALEMQAVAVGWQVYEITRRPLDLGLVGLAQFLPSILLFLVSGHVADRANRHRLIVTCYGGFTICFTLLLLLTFRRVPSVTPIYIVLVLLGVVRSFNAPANRAMLPQLVPEEHFHNAVAWASSFRQTATILGPTLGGLIYAAFRGPAAVYATSLVSATAAILLMLRVPSAQNERPRPPRRLSAAFAGLHYIWREKLILGAISLDLFAVLLGGAVALLPVYAEDILRTGPWGLGILRSAPSGGAVLMALIVAHRPLKRRAGAVMLWCVAGFGLFTVLFGVSKSFALSIAALFFVGATDMISVIVRGTLIQMATPDEMRGRVNAVDMTFVGASNELGQFESGLTAQWFGTVPAVILGGVGAILVTAAWAWMFPELRKVNDLRVLDG